MQVTILDPAPPVWAYVVFSMALLLVTLAAAISSTVFLEKRGKVMQRSREGTQELSGVFIDPESAVSTHQHPKYVLYIPYINYFLGYLTYREDPSGFASGRNLQAIREEVTDKTNYTLFLEN
jgi:hypothetical protein